MPKVTSYTVAKKLEVIKWHKQNGNNLSRTSRQFKIDRKCIRDWLQKETQLQVNNYGKNKDIRKLHAGGKVFSEELDDSLFEFLENERSDGRAVSNRQLCEEALRIAKNLCPDTEFKASSHFLNRWKKRFNVSLRKVTNESQKLPQDSSEAVAAFLKTVRNLRGKEGYTPFNIVNMDETMVRFDCSAQRTNNVKGEKSIRIANTGNRKRGFTVALTAAASGHKLPAFIIFKEGSGKIPPRVRAALKVPENVRISASVNGWMTGEKMEEWLSRIWKENEDDVRRLLIIDQAPVHRVATVSEELLRRDTDLVMIPAGCTSIVQPADVFWIKPFKESMITSWTNFVKEGKKTKAGNLKCPTRQEMIDFISIAWGRVSEETIVKSFKSCGISSAIDGSEDGEFHEKLAEVDPCVDEQNDSLIQEYVDLLFCSDSEESFDGFDE